MTKHKPKGERKKLWLKSTSSSKEAEKSSTSSTIVVGKRKRSELEPILVLDEVVFDDLNAYHEDRIILTQIEEPPRRLRLKKMSNISVGKHSVIVEVPERAQHSELGMETQHQSGEVES